MMVQVRTFGDRSQWQDFNPRKSKAGDTTAVPRGPGWSAVPGSGTTAAPPHSPSGMLGNLVMAHDATAGGESRGIHERHV